MMIAPCQVPSPPFGGGVVPPGSSLPPTPIACLRAAAATDTSVTNHALLILLGHFATHLGLIAALEALPLSQKTVDHTLHTKLIEFLSGILAGINHLQELNDAPAPGARPDRRPGLGSAGLRPLLRRQPHPCGC